MSEQGQTAHTPTPWMLNGNSCIKAGEAFPVKFIKLPSPWLEGAWDKDSEAQANAAFIVEAVNAYAASTSREAALVEALTWKPIETAPKDGSEILVAYERQNFVKQLVRWSNLRGYWESKGTPQLGLENNATHWMRIPALTAKA